MEFLASYKGETRERNELVHPASAYADRETLCLPIRYIDKRLTLAQFTPCLALGNLDSVTIERSVPCL